MNLKQLNRVLMQTLFLPVTALVLVAAVLGWQLWTARQALQGIRVADENISTITLLVSLTTNEQAGVHEFQRTFKDANLAPYEFALDPLLQNLQKLRSQLATPETGQKPEEPGPVDELIDLHESWTDKVAAPTIKAARAHYSLNDPHVDYLDRSYMEKIHSIEASLLASQEAQRTALANQWQHEVVRTVETVIVFALFGALVLGLFANSRMYMISDAYQNTMEALRSTAQATYESEQRLRATLTSIGEGVVVCDEDGRIELLNTSAQRLSGWTQAAASHRHMELVFPLVDELTNEPIGPTEFTTAAAYALSVQGQSADALPTSAILVRSDGTEYFVERSEAPIYDRAGYLTGSVIVITDVTERRRTQSALLQSEKLAVAGRLAATIAHEIHNPLDSVVNLLYMMKQGTTDEEREEFVEMAQCWGCTASRGYPFNSISPPSCRACSCCWSAPSPRAESPSARIWNRTPTPPGTLPSCDRFLPTCLPMRPTHLRKAPRLRSRSTTRRPAAAAPWKPAAPVAQRCTPFLVSSSASATTAPASPREFSTICSVLSSPPRASAAPDSACGSARASSKNTRAPSTWSPQSQHRKLQTSTAPSSLSSCHEA
jgi:PAS domain-containing protein